MTEKIPDDWLAQLLGGLPPWLAGFILLALIGLAAWVAFLFFTRRKGSIAAALSELDGKPDERQFVAMASGQEETLGRIQARLEMQGKAVDEVARGLNEIGRELSKLQGKMEK